MHPSFSEPRKNLPLIRAAWWSILVAVLFALFLHHDVERAVALVFVGSTVMLGYGRRQRGFCAAYTQIQDVIQPDTWLPYTVQRSVELSLLVQAGIVEADPQYDVLADAAGTTVNMPYWNDLDGEDEVLSDQNPLSTGKITSSQDVAANHNRGKSWKHNDLAKIFSADDPAAVAATLVGDFWQRRTQALILSLLKGIFSIASMSSHLHAIHKVTGTPGTDNYLQGLSWIDAAQRLGDRKDSLTATIMHSAVEAYLAKLNLIEWIQPSLGGERIRTFQGKRVIVDDGMPVDVVNSANVYTTYMFGRNAIAWGTSSKYAQERPEGGMGTWGAEFFREALAGNSGMITRRRMIVHPRGIKWLGASQAGATATNAELATAANWVRVWDAKKIPMVAITHNIG